MRWIQSEVNDIAGERRIDHDGLDVELVVRQPVQGFIFRKQYRPMNSLVQVGNAARAEDPFQPVMTLLVDQCQGADVSRGIVKKLGFIQIHISGKCEERKHFFNQFECACF